MGEFTNAMKHRAKAWLKQNALMLLNIADMLVPTIVVLILVNIEGTRGIIISLVVCLIVQCILCVSRHFCMWLKERIDMPKPDKRFTREEKDGEVTIEYARLQELILFMDEYENWLEVNNLVGGNENDG